MFSTGSGQMDAERAYVRAARARRIAAIGRKLRRAPTGCGRLGVAGGPAAACIGAPSLGGIHPIPIAAITATVEPSRAESFDDGFRPRHRARCRWQSVWLAEHSGTPLPPISVVRVADGAYAVRDGHHRVSVAKARGALTIDATIEGIG